MTELIAQYNVLFSVVSVILGLALLVWSADQFIDGAANLAKTFGIPSFLIGALIIGFGTSAPEMVVSVSSALEGKPNIALGNAYGSNITNIALVLGATALVSAIYVEKSLVTKEIPLLLLISFFAAWQVLDGEISQLDAILLMVLLAVVLARSVYLGIKGKADDGIDELESMNAGKAFFWLVIGFLLLVVSSRLLVWGAVNIAGKMGVSDLVIGLTVVAIGTSLPELVSSITAAKKGQHDMAIGNVVGSNVFNTLAVVGLAGMIQPMQAPALVVYRDLPVMLGLTVLLLIMCFFGMKKDGKVGKFSGVTLLAIYFGYTIWLIMTATQ